MKILRDFLLGTGGFNENPVLRALRVALFAGAAAAIERVIAIGVPLPAAYAWATPLLTGALVGGDKWILRHEDPLQGQATGVGVPLVTGVSVPGPNAGGGVAAPPDPSAAPATSVEPSH